MNDPTDGADDRLLDLLVAWEESRAGGHPLSATELCRDCPELIADLDREIHRMQSLDRFIFPTAFSDADVAMGGMRSIVHADRLPKLPGYEILDEIGRGGTGVVYKARQHSLNRYVAIKSLVERGWCNRSFVARLRQEAKALSILNDPHVVQVYDIFETSEAVSLILEYVDGENLASRLDGMPISAAGAAQFALTLARTMTVVHAQGLLHRDIKPANVLISRAGDIKIADFGLVKEEGITSGMTATGDLFGSPSYMAPEQAEGRLSDVSVRTDIYAVGATLYEMLTGRPPFVGASAVDTLSQVLHRDPVFPRMLNPTIPGDLETICLRCLEKDPNRRFATSKELGDELERFLEGRPILSHAIGTLERCGRWCKRRPAIAGLIGLSAAATIACIVVVTISIVTHQRNLRSYNSQLTRMNDQLFNLAANANEMKRIAELNERIAKDRLYVADINRAAIAWRHEDTRELTDLLDQHIPEPGEPDRRGFEWWFLRRQATLAGTVLHEFDSAVYTLCYSPDRRFLAAAGKDALVKLFDSNSFDVRTEFATEQAEVNGIAFSPDQTELATAGDDGTIRIWNIETGHERLKIKTPCLKAFQLVYTPDGTRIAVCGVSPLVYIFSTKTGDMTSSLKGHTDTIESLLLGSDGRTLITASNDQSIRIWNLDDGTLQNVIESIGYVEPLILEEDCGLLIVGTTDGKLKSIDLRNHREIGSLAQIDRIGALALHPDCSTLATAEKGGRIRLRKINRNGDFLEDDFQPWQAHRGGVHSLVWSRDGTRLISAGNDGRIQSWNYVAAQRAEPTRWTLDVRRGSPRSASRISVTDLGLSKGTELHWELSIGTRTLKCPADQYLQFMATPDGQFAMLADNEKSVRMFSVPDDPERPVDDQRVAAWQSPQPLTINGFSHDSKLLLVNKKFDAEDPEKFSGEIVLLRVPTLEPVSEIPVPSANQIEISPNGRLIAIGITDNVVLWDMRENEIVWKVPLSNVRRLIFSPDETLIAAATQNRTVHVMRTSSGESLFQIESHRALVGQMIFSPDSRTLVTSDANGTVKFTHLATGHELFEFPDLGILTHLEFASESRRLIGQIYRKSPQAPYEVVIFDGTNPEDESTGGSELSQK